ncbi:hypothetical protein [Streptomyces sp. LN325]|uniref:hypothetical protein n=1 Tax=Streptomyces sp. LN325 TaxID=3112976 RepID=UPI003714515C
MTGSWRKEREFFTSPQSKLTVDRHGHQVSLDANGLSIDGKRVVRDDLQRATEDPEFEVRPDGTVMYRDKEVAAISTPDGWKPGAVTIYGKNGPTAQQRAEEEAERRRRDEIYRATDDTQEHTRHGQEMTL